MNFVAVLLRLSCLAVLALGAEDTCGGTYRGFQYTITSPNYPDDYPSRTECLYRLQAEPTAECEQQFHLQFLDFNLKASEACRGDYLQVGDNNFYCGNTLGLRKFKGKNNSLTLTFHSDEKDTAKGFKILVSALPCNLGLSPLKNPSFGKGVPADGRSSYKVARANVPWDEVIGQSQTDYSTASIASGPPRVTSYLFLPPKETSANVTLHYRLGSAIADATSPPSELLPPRLGSISSFSKHASGLDEKIGASASSGLLDYELPQLDKPDCDRNAQALPPTPGSSDRVNYEPTRIGAAVGYASSPNLVYDPVYGFVGSGNYPPSGGYPGASGNYPGHPAAYPGYGPNYPSGAYDPLGPSQPGYPGYEAVDPNYNPSLGAGYPGIGGVGSAAGFLAPRSECCRLPSASRFSIVSPGFPAGLGANGGYSCRYTIVKSSPDVCRLRLNFRFFNFGADERYCSLGFVDIDGQRFCGCRTGQSLQLLFADYIAKTISVFQPANSRSGLASGFLIDVVQEPCVQPGLPGFQPGYLRRRSANASDIVPSPVDPNPLIRSKRHSGYLYSKPGVPFVGAGDLGPIHAVAPGPTHERLFAGNCQSRALFDWLVASKEALFKSARCPSAHAAPGFNARFARSYDLAEPTCEQIHADQGRIKSPRYPSSYPGNVSRCYRFDKAPNLCKLELYVRDFELEPSQDCAKDYLSFSVERKKYCGRSLNDIPMVFDLTQTSSVQIDFVSDERGTGRGFDIDFTQLPCEQTAKS